MAITVIKAGGKQYVAEPGKTLTVEKLNGKPGDKLTLETLLKADGSTVEIGAPTLKAKTDATIISQGRGDKILVVKFKNKTRYRRRVGHHQLFTNIKIA